MAEIKGFKNKCMAKTQNTQHWLFTNGSSLKRQSICQKRRQNRCYGLDLKCLHAYALKYIFPLVVLFGRLYNPCLYYVVGRSGSPREGLSPAAGPGPTLLPDLPWCGKFHRILCCSRQSCSAMPPSLTQGAKSLKIRAPNTSFLSGVVSFWYLVPVSRKQVVE